MLLDHQKVAIMLIVCYRLATTVIVLFCRKRKSISFFKKINSRTCKKLINIHCYWLAILEIQKIPEKRYTCCYHQQKVCSYLSNQSTWASVILNHNMFEVNCNFDQIVVRWNILEKKIFCWFWAWFLGKVNKFVTKNQFLTKQDRKSKWIRVSFHRTNKS